MFMGRGIGGAGTHFFCTAIVLCIYLCLFQTVIELPLFLKHTSLIIIILGVYFCVVYLPKTLYCKMFGLNE